jgi:NDP-sugar pyrophosphorylase family protein
MSVPVVIQAGGPGARLYPYSRVLPKPLLPVGDRPVVEILLRQLAAHGFRDVHVTVGAHGDRVRLCCGDGSRWGVRIRYVPEARPLGTAGALRRVPGLAGPFLAVNGDVLTDFDFAAFARWHVELGSPLSVATARKAVSPPPGALRVGDGGEVAGLAEYPEQHFDCRMGVYGLTPDVLRLVPEGRPCGFGELLEAAVEQGVAPRAYPFEGTALAVGRPAEHAAACELLEWESARFLPPLPGFKNVA